MNNFWTLFGISLVIFATLVGVSFIIRASKVRSFDFRDLEPDYDESLFDETEDV